MTKTTLDETGMELIELVAEELRSVAGGAIGVVDRRTGKDAPLYPVPGLGGAVMWTFPPGQGPGAASPASNAGTAPRPHTPNTVPAQPRF